MPPLKVHFEDSDESDFIDPVSPKDEPGDEDTPMVIYEDEDDEGSTPGNTTASFPTASPSKKTTGKTVKRRVTKAEREAAKFQSSLDKAAALEKPDWDGVHGRLCNLLPEHTQFRFNATVDRTPLPFDLENSFPIKPIKGIRQVETMEVCGLLDDETKPKRHKKSKTQVTLAGTPAFIQVNTKDNKLYTIVESGGSQMSVDRVKFFRFLETEGRRISHVKSKLGEIKKEMEEIEQEYMEAMARYTSDLKFWQTRVAFWAFDTGVGVFSPELKYRNQINMDDITGGDSTDPIESNTPFGRGYCGNCPCSNCRQFRVDAGKVDGAMERPDGARDSLLAEANEAAAERNHQDTETVGMDQDAMME
ncbi:MAG: hypothetical protein M1816_005534 [Peltula sp. TS41687]|nr:MAG: hypothetical protein M1816_005534 [Peltula sp. TS41687]